MKTVTSRSTKLKATPAKRRVLAGQVPEHYKGLFDADSNVTKAGETMVSQPAQETDTYVSADIRKCTSDLVIVANQMMAYHLRLREALSGLERYVAMNAMDRIVYDSQGKFEGWEKTPELQKLLDDARKALA